jgi:lysophospholipase L1-like esterase
VERPHGGSFQLRVDGEAERTVSTAAGAVGVAHLEIAVPPGPGGVEVQYNNDGPVRLLGVVMESGDPGVVYDSLAINGARASVLARYDDAHWRHELDRRKPALVVLMFGANEGANRFLVLKEYRVHLADVLRTLRSAVPYASVLVVGPLDQAKREADGRLDSWRMPEKLSRAQREVALAEGCAFFDTWTAMGGRGSMAHWYSHGMGGGDLIHPTENGARKIGTWIAEALLYGYYSKGGIPRDTATPPASDGGLTDAGG